MILLLGENRSLLSCHCNEPTTVRGTTAEVESTFPTDRRKAAAARLTVSGLSRFELSSHGQQTVLLTLQGPNVCGDTVKTEKGGGG